MAELLVSEYHDISFEERVDTACFILGQSNVILFVFMLMLPDGVFIRDENFFMDNHSDLEYLQSRAGKQAVVDTHVEGIVEWLENLKS